MRSRASLTALCAILCCQSIWALPIPVLRYDFDEASSGSADAIDHGSGASANGIFINGATRTSDTPAGYSVGAADLTAPLGLTHGAAVTTGTDAQELDALASMSVTMWVNLQAPPSQSLAKNLLFDVPASPAPAGSGGWSISILNTSPTTGAENFEVNFTIVQSSGGSQGIVTTNLDADHKWLFLAFSMQSSGLTRLYSGGADTPLVFHGSGTIANHTIHDNTEPFYIGGVPANGYTPSMWVDDVRVYDTALTQAEVDQIRLSNVPEPATIVPPMLVCLIFRGRRRARG